MPLTLSRRMDIVEQKLAGLEGLPDRMTALESQFLQLRDEIHVEFSACRKEMHAGDGELRKEMHAGDAEVRKEMQETRRVIREDIGAFVHTMRVLHEEVISRIRIMGEGGSGRPNPQS